VTLGEAPGAVQRWVGKTIDGKPVTLWVGGAVKREYWLGVSLLVLGQKEPEYLPGTKRLFSTLTLSPPQRNRALEQALTGREIYHTETDSNGSYSTTYTLRSDLSVFKQSFFSSGGVSGSTDATGRWEIVGEQLYLFFEDGQSSGRIVLESGRPGCVMFGDARYSIR
jgi:hypothetical protein